MTLIPFSSARPWNAKGSQTALTPGDPSGGQACLTPKSSLSGNLSSLWNAQAQYAHLVLAQLQFSSK